MGKGKKRGKKGEKKGGCPGGCDWGLPDPWKRETGKREKGSQGVSKNGILEMKIPVRMLHLASGGAADSGHGFAKKTDIKPPSRLAIEGVSPPVVVRNNNATNTIFNQFVNMSTTMK